MQRGCNDQGRPRRTRSQLSVLEGLFLWQNLQLHHLAVPRKFQAGCFVSSSVHPAFSYPILGSESGDLGWY
jgi:hypothetical protein